MPELRLRLELRDDIVAELLDDIVAADGNWPSALHQDVPAQHPLVAQARYIHIWGRDVHTQWLTIRWQRHERHLQAASTAAAGHAPTLRQAHSYLKKLQFYVNRLNYSSRLYDTPWRLSHVALLTIDGSFNPCGVW